MRYFLLFLLPLIAFGEGAKTPVSAGPKMGPEIEFRGKKQIPSMLCQAGLQGFFAVAFTGIAGSVYSKISDPENSAAPLLYTAAGVGGGMGVGLACIAFAIKDPGITDGYLRKIHAHLLPRQEAGELSLNWTSDTAYRALEVTHPDGRKIVFAKDPNVVEVKVSPIRPGEVQKSLDFFQKEIFETARAVGLKSPKLDGPWNGGHIHVDIEEAFGGDPRKLKNFLLDFIEHSELADGVLVSDFFSAPPIDAHKRREEIEMMVAALDHWEQQGKKIDIFSLHELGGTGPFSKRSALNLNTKFGTLEIRSLRSQKSAEELLKVMRLIQARIEYTNGLPGKEFHPKPLKMSLEEKRKAFRAYVEEAGLPYEDFKDLAPRKFQEGCPGFFARVLRF